MSRVVAESGEASVADQTTAALIPGWWDRYGVLAGITTGESHFSVLEEAGQDAWRRLPQRLGSGAFTSLHVGRQIHSADVAWVRSGPGLTIHADRDGHLTKTAGVMLGVTVADCIPVYLHGPKTGVVGLLHAGWRGVAGGIMENALKLLQEQGTQTTDVVVHLGVGICGNCYEVGPEVFERLGLASVDAPTPVDLRQVLSDRAMGAGVLDVTTSSYCSKEDRRFQSFRRDGAESGRMGAFIGFPSP